MIFYRSSLLRAIPSISTRTAPAITAFKPRSGDLSSFFAGKLEQEHWTAGESPTGKPWNVNILRNKSWTDLHQLWIILLKEKNMLYTRLRDKNNSKDPSSNPVGMNLRKIQISMRHIKITIDERQRAWSRAQKMWDLKLKGFDIYDPDTVKLVRDVEADEKILKMLKERGKYLKSGYRAVLKSRLNFEWPEVTKKQDPRKVFNVGIGKGRVLDMTPVNDRRHRSRRRLSRFREKARAEV